MLHRAAAIAAGLVVVAWICRRRRGLGSRRRGGADDGQRVRARLAHGGVTPGSAAACGTNGSSGPLRRRMRVDRRGELDTAAVHRAAHRACCDAVGDSRVDVASPLGVRRDRRRGGLVGRRATLGIGPAGRSPLASAPRTLGGDVRGVRRVPDAAGPTRGTRSRSVSRGGRRERDVLLRRARGARGRRLSAGGSASCRSRSARCWPSC